MATAAHPQRQHRPFARGAAEAEQQPSSGEADGTPSPATVADVVNQERMVVCGHKSTLAEAASRLVSRDRTSAVVLDERGMVVGAITENDVLHAYSCGVPGKYTVAAWLQSECARLPTSLLNSLSVPLTATLVEAAELLRAQADSDFACHHLVTKDEGEAIRGVLSCLDLVRALCNTSSESELARRIGTSRVQDVMKPRAVLPSCDEAATLEQALQKMLAFRQNCVLVTGGEPQGVGVQGVVTTRDALMAFSEDIPVNVKCGHWMFCLDSHVGPRIVKADAPLTEAARRMARTAMHHLVVLSPETHQVVGIVSSSDVAHALGSAERVVPVL